MKIFGYNLWVVAGIVILALILGILNNFRVYEEQRVSLFNFESQLGQDEDINL